MPSLKDLVCVVQWANTGSPFPEYGTQYGDGVVETYIAIPAHPQAFTVRLTSRKFIAEGLAMVVFIDGNYQCNRNRVNLQPWRRGASRSKTEIDFTVRQKEKPLGDGTYMGRDWRFDDHNIVSAIPDGVKESHFENLGTIEVLVLRCRSANPVESGASPASSAEHSTILESFSDFDDSKTDVSENKEEVSADIAPEPPSDAPDFGGGMFGLFDGPADYPPNFYTNQEDTRSRDHPPWNRPQTYYQNQPNAGPPYGPQQGPTPSPFDDPHLSHYPPRTHLYSDPSKGARRVHFDYGDNADPHRPQMHYDATPSNRTRAQWRDNQTYHHLRGRSSYYETDTLPRGPGPYADYPLHDHHGHYTYNAQHPPHRDYTDQPGPDVRYPSRSPPVVRRPTVSSIPPFVHPSMNPGYSSAFPHLRPGLSQSGIPPTVWGTGQPPLVHLPPSAHIPLWVPPTALPIPPLPGSVPLYPLPNGSGLFHSQNPGPVPSNSDNVSANQTINPPPTSQQPATSGSSAEVGHTTSNGQGEQQSNKSNDEKIQPTGLANPPSNDQGWANGDSWNGEQNNQGGNSGWPAIPSNAGLNIVNDDGWVNNGSNENNGNNGNTLDPNEFHTNEQNGQASQPASAFEWGNGADNNNSTPNNGGWTDSNAHDNKGNINSIPEDGGWTNSDDKNGATNNDQAWANNNGNNPSSSTDTNSGWNDNAHQTQDNVQSNENWANNSQQQQTQNPQANGNWENKQNVPAGTWANEPGNTSNPSASEATPTPAGPGRRDLYGPHGAYFTAKAFADIEVAPASEEEPRYDVPASIAQAKGISKQVQPGKGYIYCKKRRVPRYIDSLDEPYARFVFKYRTKEQIRAEIGIQIETEPTGNEEINSLETLDKAELIQLVLRAKGALGGQIPESPARDLSNEATPSFKPVPVEPPSHPYLRYNLPPGRNISNLGLGISTTGGPAVDQQSNSGGANSWSKQNDTNNQQASNSQWAAEAHQNNITPTSDQAWAQNTRGGGWDGQQENMTDARGQAGPNFQSVHQNSQPPQYQPLQHDSRHSSGVSPKTRPPPASNTAWQQQGSTQPQSPSEQQNPGIQFVESGVVGQGSSQRDKPVTPPLKDCSPGVPDNTWSSLPPPAPPPPIFGSTNTGGVVPPPQAGW